MLRDWSAWLYSVTPSFRGKGRLAIAANQVLTNNSNAESYLAESPINSSIRLLLDLRNFEQLFAFYSRSIEPEYVSRSANLFRSGDFLDIGASIGLYSTTLGKKAQTWNGRVFAVEPMPMNIGRLRENLQLNGVAEAVTILETALGAEVGTVKMSFTGDGTLLGNAKITSEGNHTVPIVPLDQLWKEQGSPRIGFLKIDTEGWDAEILMSGQGLVRTCRPPMLVEFNRERMRNHQKPLQPCWEFLTRELGYRCERLDDHGQSHPVSDPGDWENLFFLPESFTV